MDGSNSFLIVFVQCKRNTYLDWKYSQLLVFLLIDVIPNIFDF